VYLGIDQSLNGTGFAAVSDRGAYIRSDTVRVGKRTGAERLSYIVSTFEQWLDPTWDVRAVGQEGYSANSTNRPFDLGSVFGALQVAVYSKYKLEPTVVPPSSLKLFVAGNGAASKDDILYTVKTLWGTDLEDRDDEADAVGLARFVWAADTNQFSRSCEAEAVRAIKASRSRPPRVSAGRSRTPNV
jgi:Holliday junction resolvasome RuvABC endonuclease subunit